MDDCTFRSDCDGCSGRIVCHCLQITEETVLTALQLLDLTSVKEVRRVTGAGDGCTACHRQLRQLIERKRREEMAQSPASSPSPI
jgi:bacterioferritin-associated ferredoxin